VSLKVGMSSDLASKCRPGVCRSAALQMAIIVHSST
jgi:hypothetical protein